MLKAYGYDKEAMRKSRVEDLSGHGYTEDMAGKHLQNAFRGRREDFEWLAKNSQDHEFPVEVRLRRLEENLAPGEPAIVAVVRDITTRKKSEDALRALAEGALESEFDQFLQQAMRNLADVYGVQFAFVGRLIAPDNTHIQTLSLWTNDGPAGNLAYSLENTPCKDSLECKSKFVQKDAIKLFPDNDMLVEMNIDSYYGQPLIDSSGKTIGLVSIMDTKP